MPNPIFIAKRLRDVVSKLDIQLRMTFCNYVYSGNNLFSMSSIDEEISFTCQLNPNETYAIFINKVGSFNLEGIEDKSMHSNPFQVTFINLLIQKILRSGTLK